MGTWFKPIFLILSQIWGGGPLSLSLRCYQNLGSGTMGPWDHGTRDQGPWDHGTMGPWDQGPGTRDQGPGTMGPGDQGPGPRGPGTRDQGPGTRDLVWFRESYRSNGVLDIFGRGVGRG